MTGETTQRYCVPQYINYCKVAITLHCQLCSTHYQPEIFEKQLHNQSSQYEQRGSHHAQPPN